MTRPAKPEELKTYPAWQAMNEAQMQALLTLIFLEFSKLFKDIIPEETMSIVIAVCLGLLMGKLSDRLAITCINNTRWITGPYDNPKGKGVKLAATVAMSAELLGAGAAASLSIVSKPAQTLILQTAPWAFALALALYIFGVYQQKGPNMQRDILLPALQFVGVLAMALANDFGIESQLPTQIGMCVSAAASLIRCGLTGRGIHLWNQDFKSKGGTEEPGDSERAELTYSAGQGSDSDHTMSHA